MLELDHLWLGGHLATMEGGRYQVVRDAALGIRDGLIQFIGPMASLPPLNTKETHEIPGRWITPGLIDCHTHLIFGGNRADEFERRLQGVSYEQIAREGGGILSTVRETRLATEDQLLELARNRAKILMAEGVTTLEIKSGYGLNHEHELKMLRVARRLGQSLPLRVCTTFLGAHALHPEFNGDRKAYLDLICEKMIPQIAQEKLADATDAFCESIAFSLDEVRRVFETSLHHGIPVKLHADQLADGGSAALAASLGALSADHVEYTSEKGIEAMAAAGTVAVLLPGAWYTLREKQKPDIDLFRKHGVAMAVSSDCNPGSSPVLSLQTMISMACTSFRMTPEEALAGVTCFAAKALGIDAEVGTLTVGKRADLAVWSIASPAELAYWLGSLKPEYVVYQGQIR